MNKYSLLFIVTFLFLINPASTLAVADNSLNVRTRTQAELNVGQPEDLQATQAQIRQQDRLENDVQDTQLKVKPEIKSRITQAKQNLVDRVYGNIQKQLAKRYQVLIASEARIQARIDQLVSQGKDLTPASDKLAESDALKLEYDVALDELSDQVDTIHQSTQPFNQVPGLRQASQKISNILKQIRQTQVEAIKLIISLND